MMRPQEKSAAKLTTTKLQRATISQFGRMDVFGGGVLPLVRSLDRGAEASATRRVFENGSVTT